jgi:hypothetical protein
MANLNPATPIGKMRLRVGDYSDFPLMPDEVYVSALSDCQDNLPRACVLVATYILASLTSQTHQRLVQVEVYGSEWFENYLKFVKATILNPNFMIVSPVPWTPIMVDEYGNQIEVPLIQFQKDWNANFAAGTQSADMRLTAMYQPTPSYF